ncbi:DNA polymerase IV [Lacticigenium naphthae]|uniref:DNA polymerase IV n=1 Tax=Lacticigenium naphthae TaxID=515351 RepID=UPI0004149A1A|nr:DNA polymerase IV [Lacticigenium naphthae]
MKYGVLTFDDPKIETNRKIIHIDMDAFFASVEIRENPSLEGKPVIIAKHPKESGGRGVVATASYEARKYGIHSAMSAQKAYELCPKGIFISGHYDLYRDVSKEIREIFKSYTDVFEPLSLDEAYLDVTNNKKGIKSATVLAHQIQREIWEKTRLTSSAGVSYNKFIAKLASDYKKPSGITTITPEDAHEFLMTLPIEKYYGVGKKTVERMHELSIYNGKDLYEMSEMKLIKGFGKMGYSLYLKVRGIDHSVVSPDRNRKSVGKETTFSKDLKTESEIRSALSELAKQVIESLMKVKKHGKTAVLKIRYSDFETITRRKTMNYYIKDEEQLSYIAQDLWEENNTLQRGIRLLGITVTNLDPILYENIELPLWKRKETNYENF